VAVFLAVLLYRGRQDAAREGAFFTVLETTVTEALVRQQFALTSKEYRPKSFGYRFWCYERARGVVRMFWNGRDGEIVVEGRDHDSTTPVHRRIVISGPLPGDPPKRYQRALGEVLEAIDAAVKTDERVT